MKYFKEKKRLNNLEKAEAQLEPNRAFMIERFYDYT